MEQQFIEQPEETAVAPSGAAAPMVEETDSLQETPFEGAEFGQPEKKWAKMFDSPEKLEEAYGHIYRAYHAKCRELSQTQQAIEGLSQILLPGGAEQPTQPGQQFANYPRQGAQFQQQFAPEAPAQDTEFALMQAVMQAQSEAQQARELGEKFLITSLENQARDFFRAHPELGDGEQDFGRFAREVSTTLGPVDADAMNRMPEAIERAFRIVNYPEAVREAEKRRELQAQEAERYVVEGGGSGSMSVPRNQARETSFRALVQRLKREAGTA